MSKKMYWMPQVILEGNSLACVAFFQDIENAICYIADSFPPGVKVLRWYNLPQKIKLTSDAAFSSNRFVLGHICGLPYKKLAIWFLNGLNKQWRN